MCSTVYNEASSMFWGCNTFLLLLEPVGSHVPWPQRWEDFSKSADEEWPVLFAVRSVKARASI